MVVFSVYPINSNIWLYTWQHSGIGGAAAGKKNRTWKNLKQILALERTLPWKLNDPNCKLFYFQVLTIYSNKHSHKLLLVFRNMT